MDSPDSGSWRRTVLPYLRVVSHAPTPFISTFIMIHLSAPLLANAGGSSLSSQVMLLGREYYQTPFTEPWLVWTPLAIHIGASIAKRLCSPKPFRRSFSNLLSATAYGTLIFLPIHIFTHRLIPSSTSAPIFAVSPSELDFEYVKYALQTWPWRSWALYGGLVACATLHAAEGFNVVQNTWMHGSWSLNKQWRRGFALANAAAVLSGIFFIWREPLMVFSSMVSRYHAALASHFIYRI